MKPDALAQSERSTRALLAAADRLASDGGHAVFERAYRAWINEHHFVEGKLADERQDKVRLLLLAMLSGRDLRGALDIMLRFARHSIGPLSPVALVADGIFMRVRMAPVPHPGTAGLVGELWALAFHRSQLEFLTGRVLSGVCGSVQHGALVAPHVETFLFGHPIEHAMQELALCVPHRHLALPIVVSAEQVCDFVHRLLPSTSGAPQHIVEFAGLVEAMLRVEVLRQGSEASSQAVIAERLGCSIATLKRRLSDEGTSFRTIRARVQDDIAKRWLRDRSVPIARVAERLGYGDGYAFRRAFVRTNGLSPAEWRRIH